MPIIRLVKMTFQEENVNRFRELFDERKDLIASFPGCSQLELLNVQNIFFTYSIWQDANALEVYRKSDLFLSTWALVKPLFESKAEAWSLNKEY